MTIFSLVTSTELKRRLTTGTTGRLLDVREFDEFEAAHVRGAECVPLGQILGRASSWSSDEPLTLICQSGQRAAEAADRLSRVGFSIIHVVDGGTKACIAADLPVERGRRRIPIQRQVLIGAGLVVLSGLGLSFVNPAFELISWFAATMLVVAGMSGLCPMAIVLAKAPWNRTSQHSTRHTTTHCVAQGACE